MTPAAQNQELRSVCWCPCASLTSKPTAERLFNTKKAGFSTETLKLTRVGDGEHNSLPSDGTNHTAPVPGGLLASSGNFYGTNHT